MIIEMLRSFKKYIKLLRFKKRFRDKNFHNYTKAEKIFDLDKVTIGKFTYGNLNISTFGHEKECLEIGNFCSIANNVQFMLSGEHNYKTVSTYPFKAKFGFIKSEALCKGPIKVQDDVWIGQNAIILSGVTIGTGAIIGAGAVVAHDVPPYAIYVGNEVVKKRFSDDVIAELLKIDYNKLDKEFVKKNIDVFYEKINSETVSNIVNKINRGG